VLSIEDARNEAKNAGLDLVMVMADGDPPVCKLMDYGKYKYKQKRRQHQAKAKSHVTHVKEIRLHPKTEQHDIDYRLSHAREFLERGDKVLVTVLFRGREMAHMERGYELLDRVVEQISDSAKVERPVKREGRRVSVMLAPK
jgi:translation initiation factor IF-3